jgi:outer membrane usher protein
VRNAGISGQTANWNGAATWIDGQVRVARQVNDSFAVVDVAGLPDVPVYIDNQKVTETDDSGRALLHDLRPYETNRISIDPQDLPLDTEIDSRTMEVAPAFRSGVVLKFPVEKIRAGLFRLTAHDGRPVPVGALVEFNGRVFSVAREGMVYVTGFDHGTRATATWGEHKCSFRLPPPPPNDPQPDMGTITCSEHVTSEIAP